MIGGVLFGRAIQVNFADRRPGNMNLPISILDSHRNWKGIQFSSNFRIYLHITLTTKHKKEFEQNTLVFSLVLLFLRKKISLQGWRNGSIIIDCVGFPENQVSFHVRHLLTTYHYISREFNTFGLHWHLNSHAYTCTQTHIHVVKH